MEIFKLDEKIPDAYYFKRFQVAIDALKKSDVYHRKYWLKEFQVLGS